MALAIVVVVLMLPFRFSLRTVARGRVLRSNHRDAGGLVDDTVSLMCSCPGPDHEQIHQEHQAR